VGFEPTIRAFEQAKTFHALDNATIVIGPFTYKQVYCEFLSVWFASSILARIPISKIRRQRVVVGKKAE
jgi:hypothetical protein